MAPTLRSSAHVRKISDQGQQLPEADDTERGYDSMNYNDEIDSSTSDVDANDPENVDVATAEELLRPLQETADRVGRQVEDFAQALDKFSRHAKSLKGQKIWEETWTLMDTYSNIAAETADRIRTSTPQPKSNQKNRKSLGETNLQKTNMLLEAELWRLQAQVLPCHSPDLTETAHFAEQSALVQLHRYSSNDDLWKAFVSVDRIAMQYLELLEWLQRWKSTLLPDLTDIDLEHYTSSQRGESYWDAGNIFTQAPIKRQKIARAHPGPLVPDDTLEAIHYRKDDQEPLVAQMDPDAPLREDAVLEVEDQLYECSAWHASWELLTRGKTPDEIADWWRERNELWRSLALRNAATEHDAEIDGIWRRVANLASNKDFLALCRELAVNEQLNADHEKPVYSILCGKVEHTVDVCHTIDDNLFALINSLLIERYEQFLQAYQNKLKNPSYITFTPAPSSFDQLVQYVRAAQLSQSTRAEARQPYKYLESMVISSDLQTLFLDMGKAAAQIAPMTGALALFEPDKSPVNECAQVAAQDQDVVRMAVHLQLALEPLGFLSQAYESDRTAMENNIVNYISLLERHGKFALLPLYTSKLSVDRQPRILGRILSQVTDSRERETQMRLMKAYSIPVHHVIYTICDYTRQTWLMAVQDQSKDLKSAKLTEHKDRIIQIRPAFIGELDNEQELHLVQAHEWINYIDKQNWGMAAWLMTALYKTLLLSGNLAAAKELSARVSLADTSLKVTGMNLSIDALLRDPNEDEEHDVDDDVEEDNATDDQAGKLASPTKRRKESKSNHLLVKESTSRTLLVRQSTVWSHLEYLVYAMETLESWQAIAGEVENISSHEPRAIKSAKKQLTNSLQLVHEAMRPLLEQNFLNEPTDEQEDQDLAEIRNHYIPECVLAYNSALYFAGHTISRQYLVQCMDLAQEVALNDTLTKAFVASKRMQELVTAFAFDSQALLRANERGSSASKNKGRRSKDGEVVGRSDIWQVVLPRDTAE